MENAQNNVTPIAPKKLNAPEGLQFSELLQIVKLRRKLITVLMAAAVFGVTVRQILYVPLYTAQASLSIQKIENSPMQMALANLGTMPIDTSDKLKKYVDYITSHEFFLAVAENLKFTEGYNLLNLTPPSELGVTKKKFWSQFFSSNFGRKASPNASAPEPVLVPVESLASMLRGVTAAETTGTDTIRIKVTTLDPFTSMVLANAITEVFVKKTSERDYNEVTEVKRFIEQQLSATTERLKRSESSLVDFKRHHNIISISAEHSTFTTKLTNIETDLEANRIRFEENEKLIRFYENTLQKRETQLLTRGSASVKPSQSDVIARQRQRLEQLQNKKVLMLAQGYPENSWQMEEMNREIDTAAQGLREQLASSQTGQNGSSGTDERSDEAWVSADQARAKLGSLHNENKALEAKLATLEKSRNALLKSLSSLPKEEQVLLTLNKDLDLQFELYSMLKKKLQEVEIQQVALQSRVAVTDRSGVGIPAPRTGFIVKTLFALLVSCFLGGTISFLLEAIDPTVKHLSDLERMEVVTLGSIPRIQASELRASLGARTYRPDLLVCRERPESPEAMAFKYIRAQVTRMRAADGGPTKVIALTSPERGDGKSLVSSNLAVSLSQLEKKTLLIDCDLRNPSIPWYYGYKDGNGLTSVLTLKGSLDEVVIKERLPYLDILPSGWAHPNPTELLSNEKFRVLLEHLKAHYDYIVIDAPPAVALVDASVIAGLSDNVIMVTGFRKTRKHHAFLALRKILQVSNKHVYGLLNGVWDLHEYQTYAAPASLSSTIAEEESSAGAALDAKAELIHFTQALKNRKAG